MKMPGDFRQRTYRPTRADDARSMSATGSNFSFRLLRKVIKKLAIVTRLEDCSFFISFVFAFD
jgi:hypothetical protein